MSEYYIMHRVPKGAKFKVLIDGCYINPVEFIGMGSAGVIEAGLPKVKLNKGDIILWDHQAYLGSDPGPGWPWFQTLDGHRGYFSPQSWGSVSKDTLELVEEVK